MSELKVFPISQTERRFMAALMESEERAWLSELDWDYSPIRRILTRFMDQRLLPGYVAMRARQAVGYTYFLIHQHKGVVGNVFVAGTGDNEAADRLIAVAAQGLRDSRAIRRIESQILPLNGLDLTPLFESHGFESYARFYMELDIAGFRPREMGESSLRIVPWASRHLAACAGVAFRCYQGELDAVISEDYTSRQGCEHYLRSLVENPGCGIFLPADSLVALDEAGAPCGFILTSAISSSAAMIPQISIDPGFQSRGLGALLIEKTIARLRAAGLSSVRLTVTEQNRRALEWYRRLGFREHTRFGAYVWVKPGEAMPAGHGGGL